MKYFRLFLVSLRMIQKETYIKSDYLKIKKSEVANAFEVKIRYMQKLTLTNFRNKHIPIKTFNNF